MNIYITILSVSIQGLHLKLTQNSLAASIGLQGLLYADGQSLRVNGVDVPVNAIRLELYFRGAVQPAQGLQLIQIEIIATIVLCQQCIHVYALGRIAIETHAISHINGDIMPDDIGLLV